MARYINDQNKVLAIHESGTYAVPMGGSSFWIGQVQSNNITDEEGLIETRYLGTSTRNFDVMDQGPQDVNGTLTVNPQNMRFMFWAIGSTLSESGATASISTHTVVEIDNNVLQSPYTSGPGLNAPMSFTIEDSKQSVGAGRNFIRTIKGCVLSNVTLNLNQGEKVEMVIDYVGQSLTHSSGTTTSVTELTGRSYYWSDGKLTINTGTTGSDLSTSKSISFGINNNPEMPHYINGSRVIAAPFFKNREYTVDVTMDLEGMDADMLYTNFFKGGSKFNMTLDMNNDIEATGSHHASFYMSGCRIMTMDNPSELEGTTESTLTIRPETVTGSEWSSETFLDISGIFAPY